jgi:hypothetical protein
VARFAVGFQDTASPNILSGRDLSFLSAPADLPSNSFKVDEKGKLERVVPGSLPYVTWSPSGETLYWAGYPLIETDGVMLPSATWVASWSPESSKPIYWRATGIVGIRALSDGRIAVGGSLFDQRGGVIWRHVPRILDYNLQDTMRLSANGDTVQFGFYDYGARDFRTYHVGRFELGRRRFAPDVRPDDSLNAPRTKGLKIMYLGHKPMLNGRALPFGEHEMSNTIAILPKKDGFLLGSGWYLRLFDRNGIPRWKTPIPGDAWAVNLTSDGRYGVATLGDGTIRWYRVDDGQEVMALFADSEGERWVLWTPEGFYDASENADSLIGYHLNHGPDHEGEFVRVEQVKKLFYRPDILAERLKPEGDNLVRAELNRIGDFSSILHSSSPPELSSLSPAEADSDGSFNLQFRIADRGAGIGNVVYRIDGSDVEGRPLGPSPGKDTVGRVFDLPPGRHMISVTVFDGSNRLESRPISTVVNVKHASEQPVLYVVAIGISKYRDNSLNKGVKFAASDADAIAAQLKKQGRGLFRDVITQVLTDTEASRDNVEKAVVEMAARIQPADEFILYLAGHATSINGEYTFITSNAVYRSGDELRGASLGKNACRNYLGAFVPTRLYSYLIPAMRVPPSPHAIWAEKGSIERLSKLTGRVILAASSTDQMALEGYENHGVFTYAFLQGLVSAFDSDGLVQVTTLAERIEQLVPDITSKRWGYEQFPVHSLQGHTFPIARKQP